MKELVPLVEVLVSQLDWLWEILDWLWEIRGRAWAQLLVCKQEEEGKEN